MTGRKFWRIQTVILGKTRIFLMVWVVILGFMRLKRLSVLTVKPSL